MTTTSVQRQPQSTVTRLMRRVLDPSKRLDYLVVAALAAWPAIFAVFIDAYNSWPENDPQFSGYGDSPEWMVYVVGLPFALFVLRWAIDKIVPNAQDRSPARLPGVVELVASDEGREKTYDALCTTLFSPANVMVALAGTVLFHVVDIWDVFLQYYFNPAGAEEIAHGWSLAFLSEAGPVGKGENLLLAAFAYPLQFALVLMLFWFTVVAFRHNLFFLDHVYQRRRVRSGHESEYIVIDLDDPNRCFGFRKANEAFNVQVVCLMLAGAGLQRAPPRRRRRCLG